MREIRLALVGFGNVGQAFARLLIDKQHTLEVDYGITPVVTGIITGRHASCINPAGIHLEQALALISQGRPLTELDTFSFSGDTLEFIHSCPADVMIETTPVNPISGQPALSHLRQALEHGMHIITANKGPVVYGYHELKELAARQRLGFRFESAVMDGAPIFSLFRHPLRGARLLGFSGILNSCTNLLLERMEQGETLEEAIAYGASIGITETDPSNDVDGWDAAIKVAALSTVLMDHPLTPVEIDREGIRGITRGMIAEAEAAGERWKLVCKAYWQDGNFMARVRPERVGPGSPLYSVGGTSSFVNFELDVLPGLGVLESNPSPKTTAFGMLADLIDLVGEQA
jgi:homoserine dehydrogenase